MKPISAILACCVVVVAAASLATAQAPSPAGANAAVQKAPFGKTKEGVSVEIYTLKNQHGCVAKVMTYGATLTELWVPDRAGKTANVVLGFDTIDPYLAGVPYFGSTVGRYANRIAKGAFTLNGKAYQFNSP